MILKDVAHIARTNGPGQAIKYLTRAAAERYQMFADALDLRFESMINSLLYTTRILDSGEVLDPRVYERRLWTRQDSDEFNDHYAAWLEMTDKVNKNAV